jgi:hypothetical protein
MSNPPAFPQYVINNGGAYVDGGMTLRDYFAAKAMQTFLLDKRASMQDDAIDAYKMADAMLKAREA